MDVQGRLLRNFNMNIDTNAISVEGLSPGLYYIRCTYDSNDIVIRKLIVY